MEMKMFNDISSYVKDVTGLIWRYIHNKEQYPDNAQLAVQPEILTNVIDDPKQCHFCDLYDLSILIAHDSSGKPMPNHTAIQNIANRYYDVG